MWLRGRSFRCPSRRISSRWRSMFASTLRQSQKKAVLTGLRHVRVFFYSSSSKRWALINSSTTPFFHSLVGPRTDWDSVKTTMSTNGAYGQYYITVRFKEKREEKKKASLFIINLWQQGCWTRSTPWAWMVSSSTEGCVMTWTRSACVICQTVLVRVLNGDTQISQRIHLLITI